MKLFKTKKGIVIENENAYYLVENENWDSFVNDDKLFSKMVTITQTIAPS